MSCAEFFVLSFGAGFSGYVSIWPNYGQIIRTLSLPLSSQRTAAALIAPEMRHQVGATK
jgi:hypothetical protein